MNLQSLINGFDSSVKVASAEPAPAAKPTEKVAAASSPALASAINDAISSIGTEKTAAVATPAGEVAKLAAEVLGLDKEADLKHSHSMGRAFADGFVAQLDVYKGASENLLGQAKVAAEGVSADELALVKMARENPAQFIADVQRGYAETQELAEKQAAATYEETYNNLVRGIHKTASDHYVEGYAVADDVLRSLAAQR